MTHETNRYGIYKMDHTKFGGLIYPSDFNTDYRGKDNTKGSQIASRIISDRNFDYTCKKNLEKKNSLKSGGLKNA